MKSFRWRTNALDCVTDLLRIGVAKGKTPGSKQILPSVVDRAWGEDFRSYVILQPRDQFNVEPEREDLVTVARRDDYGISRVLSTKVAKESDRYVPTTRKEGKKDSEHDQVKEVRGSLPS